MVNYEIFNLRLTSFLFHSFENLHDRVSEYKNML
jgi:hypothetical protein